MKPTDRDGAPLASVDAEDAWAEATEAEVDPDRLAEITEHLTDHQDIHEDDGWWLVGEVGRLRGLLARLEWAGSTQAYLRSFCPACQNSKLGGHAAACWLAAELSPEREQARPAPVGQSGPKLACAWVSAEVPG